MGSLGATRAVRSRAHAGVAVAGALSVTLVVGLLTAAQARPWPSTGPRARTAVPAGTRPSDALVTRSALRDDADAIADGLDDASSDAVLPGTVASTPVDWQAIATPPIALEPIASAWWAATAARAPPEANASTSR